MKNRILLIICLLVGARLMHAQDNSTLADKKFKCMVASFTDLVSNTEVLKSSVFVIDGPAGTIEWQQKNGAVVSQLQISSATDEWTNTPNGRVLLNIVWEENAGTLEVKKANGNITLVMDVNPSGKDRLYFNFDLSSLEIL